MTPRVRFTPEAASELLAAAEWYERKEPRLGSRFVLAVNQTIDHISDWPDAAPRIQELPLSLNVRHALVTDFPYHVIYARAADYLSILAVAHASREPMYWLSRE